MILLHGKPLKTINLEMRVNTSVQIMLNTLLEKHHSEQTCFLKKWVVDMLSVYAYHLKACLLYWYFPVCCRYRKWLIEELLKGWLALCQFCICIYLHMPFPFGNYTHCTSSWLTPHGFSHYEQQASIHMNVVFSGLNSKTCTISKNSISNKTCLKIGSFTERLLQILRTSQINLRNTGPN